MKICTRCDYSRAEGSFYSDSRHPNDVCKPCIHRPGGPARIEAEAIRTRRKRAAVAFLTLVKQVQSEGLSLVYVMRSGRSFKIGYSKSVGKRLLQLSTGSIAPIKLLAVVPGGRELEQKLHARFAQQRTHREWFGDKRHAIIAYVATLPGAMVFLQEYLSASKDEPLLGVTE